WAELAHVASTPALDLAVATKRARVQPARRGHDRPRHPRDHDGPDRTANFGRADLPEVVEAPAHHGEVRARRAREVLAEGAGARRGQTLDGERPERPRGGHFPAAGVSKIVLQAPAPAADP